MAEDSEYPFGDQTLKLRACFVPEDAAEGLANPELVAAVGTDPVKFPAVLVAAGETPPDPSYVHIGPFELRADEEAEWGGGAMRGPAGHSSVLLTELSGDAATGAAARGAVVPGKKRAPPPNPATSPIGHSFAAGMASWRSMAGPAQVLRRSLTMAGPNGGSGAGPRVAPPVLPGGDAAGRAMADAFDRDDKVDG